MTILSLFIFALVSYADINPDFTPKWQVGDSWDTVRRGVRSWIPGFRYEGPLEGPGEPLYIHFEIVNLKEIDKEMCYVVEITEVNRRDIEEKMLLYVRKDDFTLKKVVVITKRGDGTIGKTVYVNENGHDFILFSSPFFVPMLCDFPNFPATNTDEERIIQVPDSAQTMTQKVTFIDNYTVKIELSTHVSHGLIKTTQIWEKGKPWWSSIERTFTYKDITKPGHPEVTKVEHDSVLEGIDLTLPVVTATLIPIEVEEDEGSFKVSFSASDDYDNYPSVIAVIETPTMINPKVELKPGEEPHYEFDLKDNKVVIKGWNAEGLWEEILNLGGIKVTNGQLLDIETDEDSFEAKFENNILKIEAPTVVLRVTATDASGNQSTASVTPVFAPEKEDEEGKEY